MTDDRQYREIKYEESKAVDNNGNVTIRSTPVPNECGKNKGGVGDLLNEQTKERI